MKLTEIGESRIRGYLFVLERSLRSFLPRDLANDAVREVGSHIRERADQMEITGDERATVELLIKELGSPLHVAQAYATEIVLDEAVSTGRFVPVTRAVWHLATTSVLGFLWAMLVFFGWTLGISFFAVAVLKVVFPNNVGVFMQNGQFHGIGAVFELPPETLVYPFGYWVVPLAVLIGLGIIVGTQRASRHLLAWVRAHRTEMKLRGQVEDRDS